MAVGAAAGLIAGMVGEAAAHGVRLAFPTDVWIVGFALIWALPLGALVGAVCGWRGWFSSRYILAVVAAVPGLVAGGVVVFMQWSVV